MPVHSRAVRRAYKISPAFRRLLARYPLLAIEDEREYARASEVLQELFARDQLTTDERRYVDSLAILVEKYEAEHDAAAFRGDVSPVALLRHLMDANDMSVTELGSIVGTQALASMILKGSRRISLDNAKKLAKHFRLSVEAFV
jgi:HTH-type transcriptional regulator / antitoxin HigA